MAEPITTKNQTSVEEFIGGVIDDRRRADARAVCELMRRTTGAQPAMWGNGIVGFGSYHYRYASGREGDWPPVGFSPRKTKLTLYLAEGFDGFEDLLAELGPHSTGKACLYLKRLSDVDIDVLAEIVHRSFMYLDGRTVTSGPE